MLLPAAAVAALSLLPTTLALDWFGPRPTPTRSQPDAQGWTPKPTEGPQYNVVAANPGLKLFRRQSYQFRYPNTCGYVDGNGAYSFTCDGAFGCAFNSAKFAFGCCSGTSSASNGDVYYTDPCFIDTSTTACYASTEADQCTGACATSANICSESSLPICRRVIQVGTATFDPMNFTLYDCIPLGGRTEITIQPDSSFSSFDVTPNPLVDPSYTFDGTTFVPLGAFTTTSPTSPQRSSPTSPQRQDQTSDPEGTRRKKSNAGPIAGGVVGGLAALGALAGGVIWLLVRRKRKARTAAAAVSEVSHATYTYDGK